eukprot:TRINITY_DN2682_c0_g1_i11.p1 TRINITY_DN2682_c0_g1~~TRINITY_DN2682_c0_g1_i11.p1  ORF type:complete len:286 (+),score=20.74 TRINITY_DN2682_c0_g1_i11:603-1460(+)
MNRVLLYNGKLFPFNPTPENIIRLPPKTMNNGATIVNILYHLVDEENKIDKNVPINIQTPWMYCPFGVNTPFYETLDSRGNNGSYSVDLSFESTEPEVVEFLNIMHQFDESNIAAARQHHREWFPEADEDVVRNIHLFYKSITRNRKRKKDKKVFPPRLTLKLQTKNDNVTCLFFNQDREEVRLSDGALPRGSTVRAIFSISSLWFIDGKFMSVQRAERIQYKPGVHLSMPRSVPLSGYAFVDDGNENEITPSQSTGWPSDEDEETVEQSPAKRSRPAFIIPKFE